MYQVYSYIEGDAKGSEEVATLAEAQAEFTLLLTTVDATDVYYFAVIDSTGTTVQEASA